MTRRVKPAAAVSQGEPATGFNEKVQMDFHFIDHEGQSSIPVACVYDEFSHFCQAFVPTSYSKHAVNYARGFLVHWVMVFGPPRVLSVDPGGENMSAAMEEVCELFGIRLVVGPGQDNAVVAGVERVGWDVRTIFIC